MKPWFRLLTRVVLGISSWRPVCAKSGCSQPRGSLNCGRSISLLKLIAPRTTCRVGIFPIIIAPRSYGNSLSLTLLWCIFLRTFSSLMTPFNCFLLQSTISVFFDVACRRLVTRPLPPERKKPSDSMAGLFTVL